MVDTDGSESRTTTGQAAVRLYDVNPPFLPHDPFKRMTMVPPLFRNGEKVQCKPTNHYPYV